MKIIVCIELYMHVTKSISNTQQTRPSKMQILDVIATVYFIFVNKTSCHGAMSIFFLLYWLKSSDKDFKY